MESVFHRVVEILESARSSVARAVNAEMVRAYWQVGRQLVEEEQRGEARAGYGDELMAGLADHLSERFGRGFDVTNLRRMRQFYLAYPGGSALPDGERGALGASSEKRGAVSRVSAGVAQFPDNLSWTHYRKLLAVNNPRARAFYEIEAARSNWSTRELGRQIGSLLFERLARSRNKDEVLALAREGQQIDRPTDVVKDPLVLEFLGLPERPGWREANLEQAIIDRLEAFLLELGKGFCFVARQRRLTLDGAHFFVDLVFYHRLLRCFVVIDLKLGELTHQDLGQIQMYVNYYDRFERAEHENPTVGIVLCSEKNDAMVEITLPEDNEQILAARYQLHLPTVEELRNELAREREAAERALDAASEGDDTV